MVTLRTGSQNNDSQAVGDFADRPDQSENVATIVYRLQQAGGSSFWTKPSTWRCSSPVSKRLIRRTFHADAIPPNAVTKMSGAFKATR